MTTPNSTPRFNTEEACRTYYETQIFGQPALEFFDATFVRLQAIVSEFKGTDIDTFFREVAAANVELFGLAWLQHLEEYGPSVPNCALLEEITFTKGFLYSTGRTEIWEAMHIYNDALSKSFLFKREWPNMARFRDVVGLVTEEDLNEEDVRLAWHLAEGFHKDTDDRECVARLVVRLLNRPCDSPRDDVEKVTALSQVLSLELAQRMGLDLGPTSLFGLQKMVVGLYENATGFLGSIRDYGSYQEAKRAQRRLLDTLIAWAGRRLTRNNP